MTRRPPAARAAHKRSTVAWVGAVLACGALCSPRSVAAGEVTGAAKADSGIAHAVLFDVTKIVHLRGQRGWRIDVLEERELLPDALMTVCRVSPTEAGEAHALLRRRILELGGPLKAAWLRAGKDLDAVSHLLVLTRAADLLELANKHRGDCPFYLEPQANFVARHADNQHVTINAEGGGLFSFRRRDGKWIVGGGGAGKITLGYGLSPRWAIRSGFELGGAALVDNSIRADAVKVDFIGAVPIALRRLTPTWNYDIEVAAVGLGIPWRDPMRYGFRVGGLIGLTYLRVRSLLPWGGYAVSFEYVFPRGHLPGQWTVRTGLRVGFNLRALRL